MTDRSKSGWRKVSDHDVEHAWGFPAATIDGVDYPEKLMALVGPDYYGVNGTPVGYDDEKDEGEEGYDPRVVDGADMEYLYTYVRLPEVKKQDQS